MTGMRTTMTTRQLTRRAGDTGDAACRVRRAVLIGVLASFVGFFGLSVATSPPSQLTVSAAADDNVQVVCAVDVCQPVRVHVRTRTS
jgi:hypothetical protein